MTPVFIGGSRRLSHLSPELRERLDRIVEKGLPVLIGDANGADKAVQAYLADRGYKTVEVFCTEGRCRNNVGDWPVREVPAPPRARGYEFYAAKDRQMADEAAYGLMLWDGQSLGTLQNVLRMIQTGKSVVVYLGPTREFATVRAEADWQALLDRCPEDVRKKLDKRREAAAKQSDLFPSDAGR